MERTENASGFREKSGSVKIAIVMKPEMFSELKRRACEDGKSLAAKMREYIETGLEVDGMMDDDKAHETALAVMPSGFEYATATPLERAEFIRAHINIGGLGLEETRRLFGLSANGIKRIGDGDVWRPEYMEYAET